MSNIRDIKKELRLRLYNLQASLTESEEKKESKEIIQRIEKSPHFQKAKWVMAYWPMPHEVDLRDLIIRRSDKNWVLPAIENGILILKRFEGEESLLVSKHFGILEPNGDSINNFEQIDLVLVPGVAFDRDGGRLGHGKGYYDNLLPKLKNSFKIGVGFSYQLVDKVPCEAHDYKLDGVIIVGK